jgi:hypothetical protein
VTGLYLALQLKWLSYFFFWNMWKGWLILSNMRWKICEKYCQLFETHFFTYSIIMKSWFNQENYKNYLNFDLLSKVIYPKYSKHWPYTVAHTIDCVYSKMLNHGWNHGLFLSLFKLIPCPIHWIVYVLAYLSFIFEF